MLSRKFSAKSNLHYNDIKQRCSTVAVLDRSGGATNTQDVVYKSYVAWRSSRGGDARQVKRAVLLCTSMLKATATLEVTIINTGKEVSATLEENCVPVEMSQLLSLS